MVFFTNFSKQRLIVGETKERNSFRLAMDAVAKSRELRKGDFMTGAGGEKFFGSESDSSSTNL